MIYVWLTIALGTLLLEMGHPGLFLFLSFSCGALTGALASALALPIHLQLLSCVGATIIALFFLRRFATRQYHKGIHTNVYAMQGKCGVVTKQVALHEPGYVKINGEVWSARPNSDTVLKVGTHVRVVRVVGSHVIVTDILT